MSKDATETAVTQAEIDAGAEALARRFFISGEQWPLHRFPESQQDDFRHKALAVLSAAAVAREEQGASPMSSESHPAPDSPEALKADIDTLYQITCDQANEIEQLRARIRELTEPDAPGC